jgi:hypothetical protein
LCTVAPFCQGARHDDRIAQGLGHASIGKSQRTHGNQIAAEVRHLQLNRTRQRWNSACEHMLSNDYERQRGRANGGRLLAVAVLPPGVTIIDSRRDSKPSNVGQNRVVCLGLRARCEKYLGRKAVSGTGRRNSLGIEVAIVAAPAREILASAKGGLENVLRGQSSKRSAQLDRLAIGSIAQGFQIERAEVNGEPAIG